jgi:chemotaxis response regulator CheB
MAQNANKGTDLKPSRQSVPEPIPQPVNLSPGADAELTVVGIGASTGGFEAITELLENLPQQTGMAFVLVQRLDPKHESLFYAVAVLGSKTRLAVPAASILCWRRQNWPRS